MRCDGRCQLRSLVPQALANSADTLGAATTMIRTGSIATLPTNTLDEDAWEDLLSCIEERRVIPIVGPELLQVVTDRGPRLLLDWVAEKLAVRLNVATSELPERFTLNDVVCWFLAAHGRREEAYVRLRSLLKDVPFEPPPVLRHLAAITDFGLFVTTTFDSLLERAINLERFAGAHSTEVHSYAPNRVNVAESEHACRNRSLHYANPCVWPSAPPGSIRIEAARGVLAA